jgi:hypothetical protein
VCVGISSTTNGASRRLTNGRRSTCSLGLPVSVLAVVANAAAVVTGAAGDDGWGSAGVCNRAKNITYNDDRNRSNNYSMAVALAANWEHRQMESPSSPSPASNSRTNNENENSSQNPQQPQPNLISSAGSDTASSQPQQTAHGQPQIQQPFVAQPTPWTPSPNAAPFYPSFNPFFQQNPGLAVPQQQPYFDPNAQMALAYQHMIMQQAHVLQQQQAAAALQFNMRNAATHPEFFGQHQQHTPS